MNTESVNRQLKLLVLLLLCFHCFVLRAAANDAKVVDEAGILTYEEEQDLQEQLTGIAEKYWSDVVVATVDSCEGMDVQSFTDLYYYQNGYGYGSQLNGIILLVSMQERRFHLATRGSAIDTFTDYGLKIIDDEITPYLSKGEYAKAFETFADLAEEFLEEDKKGQPYDTDHVYKGRLAMSVSGLVFAMVIAFFATFFVMTVLYNRHRSVRTKKEAGDFVRRGSLFVTRASDIFLYQTVSRTKINSSSGGHGGGGSTTHSAPGGGLAGGRSGSF